VYHLTLGLRVTKKKKKKPSLIKRETLLTKLESLQPYVKQTPNPSTFLTPKLLEQPQGAGTGVPPPQQRRESLLNL